MALTEIINETGAAGTHEFSVNSGFTNSMTVIGQSSATFTVDLEYTLDGGTTWSDVYNNGTQIQISDTNTHVPVNMPGDYRISWTGQPAATRVMVVR